MKPIVVRAFSALCLVTAATAAPAMTGTPDARLLSIDGAIGPAMAGYVHRGLTNAERAGAPFVVIRIDTPGGLSDSMRSIIKDILAAPIPVVCWVGPEGARAASAGTYILYSCGLAAMAPGTNVGAATPVSLMGSGSTGTPAKPKTAEGVKTLNDAIAYIQSLAQLRGRNAAWAEKAVRQGASISAQEALSKGVINRMSPSLNSLLSAINGETVPTANGKVQLRTQGVGLTSVTPDWRERLLQAITNPTVAYLLFIIGIYGLLLEGLHPGIFLPGTVGAICLILALFAFHALPVNYAGLALILLGAGLLVAEAFVPSFGTLGLGGIAAFIFGSIMLIDTNAPGYTLPRLYIGSIGAAAGFLLGGIIYLVIRMRRRPVVSGLEGMIGLEATALEDFSGNGWVRAAGERWHARCTTPVTRGDRLVIESVDGLWLQVHPVSKLPEG